MYRNELKYFVNPYQKAVISRKLDSFCQKDRYSDLAGGYLVSSLYFDDYTQSALMDKLSGIQDRRKFRIRVYNRQSDVIKLERKIKRGYMTEKTSLRISRKEYDALLDGDAGWLKIRDNEIAKDFYLNFQTRNLRPKVIVEYRRDAYIFSYGDVRITFDHHLMAGIFQKDLFAKRYMISAIPQDQIILEVKYTGFFPAVIRNLIQIENLQWQSSSKYVKCCVLGL